MIHVSSPLSLPVINVINAILEKGCHGRLIQRRARERDYPRRESSANALAILNTRKRSRSR